MIRAAVRAPGSSLPRKISHVLRLLGPAPHLRRDVAVRPFAGRSRKVSPLVILADADRRVGATGRMGPGRQDDVQSGGQWSRCTFQARPPGRSGLGRTRPRIAPSASGRAKNSWPTGSRWHPEGPDPQYGETAANPARRRSARDAWLQPCQPRARQLIRVERIPGATRRHSRHRPQWQPSEQAA